MEGETQQKEVPNDLKIVLPSERELEKYLEHNRNKNGNNLRLHLHLGSLLCKQEYSLLFMLCCLKNTAP